MNVNVKVNIMPKAMQQNVQIIMQARAGKCAEKNIMRRSKRTSYWSLFTGENDEHGSRKNNIPN